MNSLWLADPCRTRQILSRVDVSLRRSQPHLQDSQCSGEDPTRPQEPGLDLRTADLAAQTPLAVVLAVVREQPIAVFAEPRASTVDHFRAIKARRRARSNPHGSPVSKVCKGNFFDRSALPASGKPRIVDDLAGADVDAVMGVAASWRDQMRSQGWFVAGRQIPVEREGPRSGVAAPRLRSGIYRLMSHDDDVRPTSWLVQRAVASGRRIEQELPESPEGAIRLR